MTTGYGDLLSPGRMTETDLSYLPPKLEEKLMPFQIEGVRKCINKSGRCMIADDMGLGKTLQALSVAYYYKDEWPLLIIVPSSLRYPWIEEIEKWFPEINPNSINLIQGGADISNISSALITVVTYGLLRHPASKIVREALLKQNFNFVILDESHYIKNRKTESTKYVVPLVQQAKRKLLLTGTPALARPEELYPQLDAINPSLFGSWAMYSKKYCDAKVKWFGRNTRRYCTDGASNLDELQAILADKIMIRRLKKDVLSQLPPKQRQKVPFHLKESNIKKDIDETWKELQRVMGGKNERIGSILKVAPVQNPMALEEESGSFGVYSLISSLYHKTGNAKIGPVREYLRMLLENKGLKVLVFAYHRIMMDALCEEMVSSDVKFIRIDGSTIAQDRPRLVHQFQSDESIRVAILSIKAAGVGLTFTAANLVVFAELDWTPGTLEQCEDRAHRIGQQGTVHVHYLVAKGTLDEWIWSALAKKTTVVTTTLNGETQELRMDDGNKEQIDILTNADAYMPTKVDDIADSSSTFFNSPQMTNQKSVLDYFTPKGSKISKKKGLDSPGTPLSRKRKTETSTGRHCEKIITIDLGDDELGSPDDFKTVDKMKVKAKRKVATIAKHDVSSNSDSSLSSDELPDLFVKSKKRKRAASGVCDNKKAEIGQDQQSVRSSRKQAEHTGDGASQSQWSCRMCTFLNHKEVLSCEICNTPKQRKTINSLSQRRGISTDEQCSGDPKCRVQAVPGSECGQNSIKDDKGENSGLSLNDPSTTGVLAEQTVKSRPGACSLVLQESSEETKSYPDKALSSTASKSLSNCDINKTGKSSKRLFEQFTSLKSATSPLRPQEQGDDTSYKTGPSDNVMEVETKAAQTLFSSGVSDQAVSVGSAAPWECPECGYENEPDVGVCDGCLENKPVPARQAALVVERNINLDEIETYELLQYCCSQNTSRIYLHDQDGGALDANFIPLDVELENYEGIPDILFNPNNMKLVKRFIREWNSLNATKRRVIIKSGLVFVSPLAVYDELKSGKKSSTQRYTSKADVASSAISKAASTSGHLRAIHRPGSLHTFKKQPKQLAEGPPCHQLKQKSQTQDLDLSENFEFVETMKGLVQVVDSNGRPACISCHNPFTSDLVSEKTIQENPWQTRFCSNKCAELFWVSSNRHYGAQIVYEEEHGICQICNFDAQDFLQKLKVTSDLSKRASFIKQSHYNVFKPAVKDKMVKQPARGMFWHVDHINPVAEGGGECQVDNLRTLCTVCHQTVTLKQNKEREANKRHQVAAKCGDITAFFKPKNS